MPDDKKPEHVHGAPDSEKDWLNDLLGRGAGDPDLLDYPGDLQGGEPEEDLDTLTAMLLGDDKAVVFRSSDG